MRLIFILLFSILLPINIFAYKIKIVTTIPPIAGIIYNILPDADVHIIIRNGENPHTYAPTPRDIKYFNQADIFVKVGFGFENWFNKILNSIEKKRLLIIDLSQNVSPIGYDKKNGFANPHYWLSPYEIIKVLPLIKYSIISHFPDKKEVVEKNYSLFIKKLTLLDKEFRSKIKKLKKREIVESHPLLDYIARDYGLKIVGVIKKKGNVPPSPKEVVKLINNIKKYKIKYLLTSSFDKSVTLNIAKDTHLKLIDIDPLGFNLKRDKDLYIKLIRKNFNSILKALK